jgi:hypothetical protein
MAIKTVKILDMKISYPIEIKWLIGKCRCRANGWLFRCAVSIRFHAVFRKEPHESAYKSMGFDHAMYSRTPCWSHQPRTNHGSWGAKAFTVTMPCATPKKDVLTTYCAQSTFMGCHSQGRMHTRCNHDTEKSGSIHSVPALGLFPYQSWHMRHCNTLFSTKNRARG